MIAGNIFEIHSVSSKPILLFEQRGGNLSGQVRAKLNHLSRSEFNLRRTQEFDPIFLKMEAQFFDFDQYRGTGTLNEFLDILFEDEEKAGDLPIPESIYVAPPDLAVLTDEDSGDEDSSGRTENLNARQLTA
ncbi:hypothetical protein EVAR_60488_1 [Eumeta japonica]|uniref:Uncharacterized protein n=1 Tax=Eumeta variegata TaxID=151549 RepID=A0A4C1ZW13_EUMVA|nr:hypothetical protein EVAR_60488_1 [Eumeta japonica]